MRLDAAMRRVEDFDDAQPGLTVRHRLLAGLNARDEVLGHLRQRLASGQIRRPDVATPVADQRLAALLQILADIDSAIKDFDLLVDLEVVINKAALAPADDHLTNFDRR